MTVSTENTTPQYPEKQQTRTSSYLAVQFQMEFWFYLNLYWVAKTYMMPYLCMLISAKEPQN